MDNLRIGGLYRATVALGLLYDNGNRVEYYPIRANEIAMYLGRKDGRHQFLYKEDILSADSVRARCGWWRRL